MLKVEDLKAYDITTPLEKKLAGINSSSTDAYTWVDGKPFDVISEYVYQGDGGVMLWAPTTGAATSSVHRTRTELKGKPYYLKDQQVHIFTVKSKMHKINWFGSIVVMQMHCQDGNDPTLKTFLTKNSKTGVFQLLNGLRTGASSGDPAKELLLDNVDISKEFDIKYTITKDGLFTVEASQGDNKGKIEKQVVEARAKRSHVFHAGLYNQQNMGDTNEPVGDGSLVELLDFSEYHGDIPVVVPPVITPLSTLTEQVEEAVLSWNTGLKTLKEVEASIEAAKQYVDATHPVSPERTAFYSLVKASRVVIRSGQDYYANAQEKIDQVKADYEANLRALKAKAMLELDGVSSYINTTLKDAVRNEALIDKVTQAKSGI